MNTVNQSRRFGIATLLLGLLLVAAQADVERLQNPSPPLSWQDWRLVGSCGGVDYLAAISSDDGHNDFELKLKIDNKNSYAIQTRLSAVVHSENAEKKNLDNVGLGKLNGNRASEACSTIPGLCFGALFPSAVFQKQPTRIAKLVLTNVDVANIDAPPANASPAVYLDPYRDYPHTKCRDLSITFQSDIKARFVSLTDRCVLGLPKWSKPDCDDAVDEILKAFKQATSPEDQKCIKQWRDYQKCYEIYAFESNPVPRPSCERPACRILNKR
jgi:hypothetical protein